MRREAVERLEAETFRFGQTSAFFSFSSLAVIPPGRILLVPKADLRKLLGRSPDQADALALAVGAVQDSWISGGGLAYL